MIGRMRPFALLLLSASCVPPAGAQWVLQKSDTTADLRGIHSVGGGVAWASGAHGTVLRTADYGANWKKCAQPDATSDGSSLDFRGIQAWDNRNAIVMSSGPGEKSRLYGTDDGCQTWRLLFKNPDQDGFWDTLYFTSRTSGWLLGDPVAGTFTLFHTSDAGRHWTRLRNQGLRADAATQGAFAASNSSLIALGGLIAFGAGGKAGAAAYSTMNLPGRRDLWKREMVPLGSNTDASGVFSLAGRAERAGAPSGSYVLVIVGGDYTNPDRSSNTAAARLSGDQAWTISANPPHGYRSSVQWTESLEVWIAVGPNGTDTSRDDGRTWYALKPAAGDSADADKNWNALSLPFVVGPGGRIGRLREDALAR